MLKGLPDSLAPRKIVSSSDHLSTRLLKRQINSAADFMAAEAAGSRIRQRNQAIDPDDARTKRLKARVTLPSVKGYSE